MFGYDRLMQRPLAFFPHLVQLDLVSQTLSNPKPGKMKVIPTAFEERPE
jgi:hypothetical protein